MPTKTITRRQVLAAVRREPLKQGQWFFAAPEIGGGYSFKKGCKVCAVGAVLRRASFETAARRAGRLDNLGHRAVFCSPLLRSLSNFFESLPAKMPLARKRQRLVGFVKRNFPASFKLSVSLL